MDDEALKIRKWADTGDRLIPEDASLTPAINRAVGWPASFSQEDGDRPRRPVVNQIFRELTGLAVDLREHGILEYDATQDYEVDAIVQHGDPPLLYQATAANGPGTTVKTPGGMSVTEWVVVAKSTNPPGAPPTPQAEAGQGTIRWFWACPRDNGALILDFQWQRRIGAQDWDDAATGVLTTLHFDDTGLVNGTQYGFRYRARNSEGYSTWSAEVTASPQAQVPDRIRGAVGFGTSDSIEVHWAEPDANGADITQYEIQWRESSGSFAGARTRTTTARTYTITGLDASTLYQFRVRARNARGWGQHSDIVNESTTAVTGPTIAQPDAPQAPVGTPSQGAIRWQWAAGADNGARITSFQFQWRTGSDAWSTARQETRTYAFWDQTGLDASTTVEGRVRAINSEGASPWTSGTSATTPAAPDTANMRPAAPAHPTGVFSDEAVSWTWLLPSSDGGSPITGFDFQWRRGGSGSWVGNIQTVTATCATVTVTGANIGTSIEARVRAKNANGNGEWSDAGSVSVPPDAPSLAAAAGAGRVNLTITPPSDRGSSVTGYTVQWRAQTQAYATSRQATRTSSERTYAVTSLTNGTPYAFRVRATSAVGNGPWSDEVDAVPVSVPDAPSAPNGHNRGLVLTWAWDVPDDNGGDITGFDFQWRESGDSWVAGNISRVVGTFATVAITTSLTGTIQARARAVNASGNGPWSGVGSVSADEGDDVALPGTILDFGGSSVPTGYLACNGNAVSRITYSRLYSAIGTTWGAGNGNTTFNVPNLIRRTTVGSGGDATAVLGSSVGSVGGSESHTLTTNQMPGHTHAGSSGSAGSHSHGSGTLSASSAGSHSHGSGTLSSASAGSHTHTLNASAASVAGHGHGAGTLSSASAGSHGHRIAGITTGGSASPRNTQVSRANPTLTNPDAAGTYVVNVYIEGKSGAQAAGAHSHSFTGTVGTGGAHTHTISGTANSAGSHSHTISGSTGNAGAHTHSVTGSTGNAGAHTHSVTIGNTGGGQAHNNMQPSAVVLKIIKT